MNCEMGCQARPWTVNGAAGCLSAKPSIRCIGAVFNWVSELSVHLVWFCFLHYTLWLVGKTYVTLSLNQQEIKSKITMSYLHKFSCAWLQLHVFALSSHSLIALLWLALVISTLLRHWIENHCIIECMIVIYYHLLSVSLLLLEIRDSQNLAKLGLGGKPSFVL